MTLTKIFGPMLGADQVVALGEVAADWIFDMEDKDELRYDGPGTATSANRDFLSTSYPMASSAIDMPGVSTEGFADAFSWGYRLAIRMDYNDVLASVNLKPSVSFSHDVNGTTPGPLGNFVEDRKIVTVTLTAEYLNALRFVTSYTNYFDGGKRNSLNDRDFVSVAASLSF